jgi:hypothetical protein
MRTAKPTKRLAADSDLGAVGLVDDTVNLLEVVRVGDDLVTGEDILGAVLALCKRRDGAAASCAQSMVKPEGEGGVVAQARATQGGQARTL